MSGENYKIHHIGLGNVSSYLIYRPGEAILIDCGKSGSEDRILDALKRLGLEPAVVKLLVLTHSHFDHAGSAGRLKELTGCKVMIHRSEAERLRSGYSPIPSGTRWKAKLLVTMGRIFARKLMRFPGVEPDLLLDESFDLQAYGFPGNVIHTPTERKVAKLGLFWTYLGMFLVNIYHFCACGRNLHVFRNKAFHKVAKLYPILLIEPPD